MMKVFAYDNSGFLIFYKRLSRGTFQLPATEAEQKRVTVDSATLAMMLEGIDLPSAKRRLRYQHRPQGDSEN